MSKKTLFILCFLLTIFLFGMAATVANCQTTKGKTTYKAWVEGNKNMKGYLRQLKDSSIVLTPTSDLNITANSLSEFKIDDIQTLAFRENHKKSRNTFNGVLIGVVAGGAIGYVLGDDSSCNSFFCGVTINKAGGAFLGMLGGGLVGGIVGGIVGSSKIKIPLNGQYENYIREKNELEKYRVKFE